MQSPGEFVGANLAEGLRHDRSFGVQRWLKLPLLPETMVRNLTRPRLSVKRLGSCHTWQAADPADFLRVGSVPYANLRLRCARLGNAGREQTRAVFCDLWYPAIENLT